MVYYYWGHLLVNRDFRKMQSAPSRIVLIVTKLEDWLRQAVRIGLFGTGIFGSCIVLYMSIRLIGGIHNQSPQRSSLYLLQTDPLFLIAEVSVGLCIVLGTTSLLLYHFLTGFEDERSQFAVLLGFIGLGFGGGILRLTLFPAYHIIRSVISISL